MSYRIEIDTDSCVSSGKCVADHPQAFGFDEDELAVVLPGASSLSDEVILRAARRCPSGAIQLYDPAGNPVEL